MRWLNSFIRSLTYCLRGISHRMTIRKEERKELTKKRLQLLRNKLHEMPVDEELITDELKSGRFDYIKDSDSEFSKALKKIIMG